MDLQTHSEPASKHGREYIYCITKKKEEKKEEKPTTFDLICVRSIHTLTRKVLAQRIMTELCRWVIWYQELTSKISCCKLGIHYLITHRMYGRSPPPSLPSITERSMLAAKSPTSDWSHCRAATKWQKNPPHASDVYHGSKEDPHKREYQ